VDEILHQFIFKVLVLSFVSNKSACQPPHHKGRRSRSERAPGQSEDERGSRIAEEKMGDVFLIWLTAKVAKIAKDVASLVIG
jgi:hypothetical protein